MKKTHSILAGLVAGTLCSIAVLQPALANDEKPPPGAMALSVILTQLEQQGYTPVVEVSLDNARWEVEAYKEGQKYQLEVDPNSGEIVEVRKDSD
ncbi:PepSY domain-containing protein [uncultured Microbulbifer sp.]|uniref:PepSY domain-containing protein n=1 Tax=uncultured Microbulbifer sp. TaxID=348147 RepID=UPI0025D5529D|nr:PepSY domain-containing protein [uncultured Microbulbifer sp.]